MTSNADTLVGKVIRIADGDTLTILADGETHGVRLAGIDAPKKGQSFRNCVKQNLVDLDYTK